MFRVDTSPHGDNVYFQFDPRVLVCLERREARLFSQTGMCRRVTGRGLEKSEGLGVGELRVE